MVSNENGPQKMRMDKKRAMHLKSLEINCQRVRTQVIPLQLTTTHKQKKLRNGLTILTPIMCSKLAAVFVSPELVFYENASAHIIIA